MKLKYNTYMLKNIIVTLIVVSVIGVLGYLFIYDLNKPSIYQPEMDTEFLQSEIERIATIEADSVYMVCEDEILITQDGFKGMITYYCCEKPFDEEIKGSYHDGNGSTLGELIRISDSAEIFVWQAYYTPIVSAWGYGWLNHDGNLYANSLSKYGYADKASREAAEGKPNFRSYFKFTIMRDNELFFFELYCNTDNAEKALSGIIDYINNNVI